MDLEIKKDMINSHFNNLIALYVKLNAYKEKILGEGSSIDIDSLESVQKKEQLLILAGSINEIQKVLNEGTLISLEFMKLIKDIELGDIDTELKKVKD